MGVSKNNGTPQIINFNRVFHYKPSILGYPYFWKHPNVQNFDSLTLSHGAVKWMSPSAVAKSKARLGQTSFQCQELSGWQYYSMSIWKYKKLKCKAETEYCIPIQSNCSFTLWAQISQNWNKNWHSKANSPQFVTHWPVDEGHPRWRDPGVRPKRRLTGKGRV